MPYIEDCIVKENIKIAPDYYKMTFACRNISKDAKPGQFLQIKVSDNGKVFLRRPFGYHSIKKNEFSILYHVVGKGTKALTKARRGKKLSVIGPLGNPFNIVKGKTAVLIAGGAGIAPLMSLEEELRKKKIKSIMIMGARTKNLLLCKDKLTKLGSECLVCTDDGSEGPRCTAPALFLHKANELRAASCVIYSCGPAPMLKAVADIARKKKIKAQLSMEEYMACGIGICFGCVVKTKKGMKRACKDGPVFDSSEVIWE